MTKSMLQLAMLIGIITTRLIAPSTPVAAVAVEAADVATVDTHAYVSTPPARVDAIQQMGSSALSGITFVRLVGVACPGRSDGFFIVPNNTKQPLELQVLLLALDRGFKVRMSGYDPTTCVTSSVSVCATTSPC